MGQVHASLISYFPDTWLPAADPTGSAFYISLKSIQNPASDSTRTALTMPIVIILEFLLFITTVIIKLNGL